MVRLKKAKSLCSMPSWVYTRNSLHASSRVPFPAHCFLPPQFRRGCLRKDGKRYRGVLHILFRELPCKEHFI